MEDIVKTTFSFVITHEYPALDRLITSCEGTVIYTELHSVVFSCAAATLTMKPHIQGRIARTQRSVRGKSPPLWEVCSELSVACSSSLSSSCAADNVNRRLPNSKYRLYFSSPPPLLSLSTSLTNRNGHVVFLYLSLCLSSLFSLLYP